MNIGITPAAALLPQTVARTEELGVRQERVLNLIPVSVLTMPDIELNMAACGLYAVD